ncbi:lysophospholipid acyltransferase family protein [Pseudobacteriovorax antillogorgiicola]|uniref:DUF374 domain-containing protein n=1 Tax=Pseudobacteriovorax antillogorgiicola TaxID=1513793 RepID=A0A1Y6BZN5_9BACT|nr:lysophospholipid acyltransferase family protein [Pseudobacteriovorax antillogorgiicola]TCS51159.1 hypothetical protein EDD56_11142 [Pseudobacteriovorax antillogorgiicola]SMF38143.1 hypothetical protein SAMN06296036_111136 [Pseudobacteriovorax antillogorgiicola]
MNTYLPASQKPLNLEKLSFLTKLKIVLTALGLSVALRLLHWTLRYQYFRMDHRQSAEQAHSSGSYAPALWHQNAVASLIAHQNLDFKAMVSSDLPGEIIVKVLSFFGYDSIRGEPARGGRVALREIYAKIPSGIKVAMTVDGPEGPRHEVKAGVVAIASTKAIPILPVAAVADRYWELKTWDRLRIPKPFAKVRVMYGQPIVIKENCEASEFEQTKIQVSQALHRIERQMARFRIY